MDYIEEVIEDNPKNYQVWHHRRVIVEWLNDPSRELELTENILALDSKNYHAWQHRQWAIKTYKYFLYHATLFKSILIVFFLFISSLFDDELQYVDRLISEDLRNNSAWNQRFFVLKYTGITPDVLQREINYAINRIRLIKTNESSWNFLRGLLQQDDGALDEYPEVVEFSEELYNTGNRSPYLLAFLIDIYVEQGLRELATGGNEEINKKVYDLCDLMATKHDTIRYKYWNYIAENFRRKVGKTDSKEEEPEDTGSSQGLTTEDSSQSLTSSH